MTREIRMKELNRLLPLIMYREHKRHDNFGVKFTVEKLVSTYATEGFEVTSSYASQAIGDSHPYIKIEDYRSPTTYSITKKGMEEAERLQDEIYGSIPLDTPLAEATAPAADRIVPLYHNRGDYKEVMGKLDELIATVEKDRSNDFEEKERVLGQLRAGKTLLEPSEVDKIIINAVLIVTLNWLIENCTEIIIGLATVLLEMLKPLLGF